MMMPQYLNLMQYKGIDIWIIIQASFADALSGNELNIHLNQLLVALSQQHTLMAEQGLISPTEQRYVFTEQDAEVVTEIYKTYTDYLQSVFLYNNALYMALKTNDYQIHLHNTVLLVEY